jgi:hypothetical protein
VSSSIYKWLLWLFFDVLVKPFKKRRTIFFDVLVKPFKKRRTIFLTDAQDIPNGDD